MPEQFTNLKVFVASPSDVSEERKLLEQVVIELNKLIGTRLKYRLQLIKWESDTYPGLGDDAQDVINKQIGDDYDVFIGIIWKKLGTPTKRGQSGTIEEFTRAYNRAVENHPKVHVMFYFNDTPYSPSEMDVEQLLQINTFRKSIGEKGVYYWEYKSIEEFERLVKMHLGKVMQDFADWSGQETKGIKPSETDISIHEEENIVTDNFDDNEEGFLDLVIESVDEFNSATQAIQHVNDITQEMTTKNNKHVEQLNGLPQPINPRLAKSIIDNLAQDMEDYVNRIKVELPILSKSFQAGIDAYTKSGQLLVDMQDINWKQIEDALSVLGVFKTNNIKVQESTTGVKDSIQKLPRMTTRFNHAKRHVIETLDNLLEEYRKEENLTLEAQRIFSDFLDKRE